MISSYYTRLFFIMMLYIKSCVKQNFQKKLKNFKPKVQVKDDANITEVLVYSKRIFAIFRWGHLVATYPWVVICSTFTITTLLSLGFLNFRYLNIFSVLLHPTSLSSLLPFESRVEINLIQSSICY